MPRCFWHVRQFSLFEKLDPEQWERLERGARKRTFTKGSSVYLPNDASDSLFLLQEGRVRLSSCTSTGKLAILDFIEPGEVFGELSLIDPSAREERADAVAKSTIVMLPLDNVSQLMEQSASATLGITRLIGMRRRRVERRLRSLLFRSHRQRLAALLAEFAVQYPIADPNGIRISIRLSHQDLASLIGSTRESVTLIMNQWVSDGIIANGRQQIVLHNLAQLLLECEG